MPKEIDDNKIRHTSQSGVQTEKLSQKAKEYIHDFSTNTKDFVSTASKNDVVSAVTKPVIKNVVDPVKATYETTKLIYDGTVGKTINSTTRTVKKFTNNIYNDAVEFQEARRAAEAAGEEFEGGAWLRERDKQRVKNKVTKKVNDVSDTAKLLYHDSGLDNVVDRADQVIQGVKQNVADYREDPSKYISDKKVQLKERAQLKRDSIIDAASNKFNNAKVTIQNTADLAKRKAIATVDKAKNIVTAPRRVFKNTKDIVKNGATSVKHGVSNAVHAVTTREGWKQMGRGIATSFGDKMRHFGNNISRWANKQKDKILDALKKVKKFFVTFKVFFIGAAIFLVVINIVIVIIGVFRTTTGTPHYYCDLTAPSSIKHTTEYRLYCRKSPEKVVYFQQNGGQPWSGANYGVWNNTYANSACGITSGAIAVATLAEDTSLDPQKLYEGSSINGGLNRGSCSLGGANPGSYLQCLADVNGWPLTSVTNDPQITGVEGIKKLLGEDGEGCFVQVCGSALNAGGGSYGPNDPQPWTDAHYVLIVDYDENGFFIADPWRPKLTTVETEPGDNNNSVGENENSVPYQYFEPPYDVRWTSDSVLYCPIK